MREQKLLEFLQNECGQQPLLRHLGKLLQEVEANDEVFRATAVNALALSSLQLELRPLKRSPMAHMEQLFAERYLLSYPHRRLQWTGLGAVLLSWRHAGHTLLTVSERQATLLLALDEGSQVPWDEGDEELRQLLLGPLEQRDGRLRLRAGCQEAPLSRV